MHTAHMLREDPHVRVVFGDRGIGNASLRVGADGAAGRRRLLGLAGLSLADAVFMEQVHSGAVARVGRADRGRGTADRASAVPGVDALVTTDEDVALVILTADCVPVLLCDPGRGIGAVHAGRRGVEAGVVGAAVIALAAATGSPPSRLVALVGPAIGGCCYEVPLALADEIAAVAPGARVTTRWGTPGLDLPAAVRGQLQAEAVGLVSHVSGCTRCEPDRWFSHRAATAVPGSSPGRNASVVCRRRKAVS